MHFIIHQIFNSVYFVQSRQYWYFKMFQESIVSSRPDRVITKKIVTPGDFSIVPYEESRCTVVLSNVRNSGESDFDSYSRFLSPYFDGVVLIGDSDSYIDRDFELILQQMCLGETCEARIIYKLNYHEEVKEIICYIELKDVTQEQLVSDWSWARLYEAALHNKARGVDLVRGGRLADAFRRFSKAFKLLVAIEPINPETTSEDSIQEIFDLKVILYNNLAHCQLQFHEYEAALELCNGALKYDPDNIKALYRRCLSYQGLQLFEEAWNDIQKVLQQDPSDRAAQMKAAELRPTIERINVEYASVIKKMFK